MTSLAIQWLNNARAVMDRIEQTQIDNIRRAAEAMADSIEAGRWVHVFGCGHATIPVEEMYPRIGGFVGFHPMVELPMTFFTRITGETDMARSLKQVRRSHAGLLCVTLGPGGAMLLSWDELVKELAFNITAVDTTGAGDVFRAAFIYGLLAGSSPRDLLRFANAAAAVSCTRAGAMNSVPTRDEVERLLTGG